MELRQISTMDWLRTLATTWYSTRLQENSRRPQPDEMRSISAGLGLGGDFWDPSRILSVNEFLMLKDAGDSIVRSERCARAHA